jgi:antitoxin component YwqK of YwqJK toxin-antitoxin module
MPARSPSESWRRFAAQLPATTFVSFAVLVLVTSSGCGGGDASAKKGAVETIWYDPETRALRQAEGELRFGLRLGEWTFWHRNQSVEKKGRYDDQGRETGDWVEYYPNQVEKARMSYVAGQLDGPMQVWHDKGTLASKGLYSGGKRVGLWETFHDNGAPATRATYVDGQLDGEAVGWYPDGTESERARYRAGSHVGTIEAFHPSGKVRARKTLDERGLPQGDSCEWFEDGQLKAIKRFGPDGREHGLEETYHADGALASLRTFAEGRLVGISRGWHAGGGLWYEGHYVANDRHGIWRYYHPDGSRQMVEHFRAGKRRGISRNWFAGGQLHTVSYFDDDEPRGLLQQWYPNGQRRVYSQVDGPRISGLNLEWTEDGALQEEVSGYFRDGVERTGPPTAEDLQLAAELAADPAPRPLPADLYDPLPEVVALEARPAPLPVLPSTSDASRQDR